MPLPLRRTLSLSYKMCSGLITSRGGACRIRFNVQAEDTCFWSTQTLISKARGQGLTISSQGGAPPLSALRFPFCWSRRHWICIAV